MSAVTKEIGVRSGLNETSINAEGNRVWRGGSQMPSSSGKFFSLPSWAGQMSVFTSHDNTLTAAEHAVLFHCGQLIVPVTGATSLQMWSRPFASWRRANRM